MGVSVLVGTTIGAGVLGIPYVAAKAGFFVALSYILLLGSIVLTVNLYLGEIVLRTKKKHQIAGYANKYLGRKGRFVAEFAIIFHIYAALIAYMLGIGQSLSFLIFGNNLYGFQFAILTGVVMSGLLWQGLKALKHFEKLGVSLVLFLLALIFFIFIKHVEISNLITFNHTHVFLPLGVVLFALTSFYAIPEINLVLNKKDKKLMKKILIVSSIISVLFYSLFTFVIVGSQGAQTPEIATLSLGVFFVLLGILTMFTSYLALGNALEENFRFDDRMSKKTSWFLSAIGPVLVFIIIKLIAFEFFSFTKILAMGGVISGSLISITSLLMVKKAKELGDRKPEYSIPTNWLVIGFLALIFVFGIIIEFFY